MTHKTEVNIKIPDLDDLCCVNCQIDPIEMQDPIVKSLFHCQILTCRLIIYSVRCCIASPSIQNIGNLIHVIVSKKFYTTCTLQNHLSNLKVQFSDPEPVHPKIYEACLKYTITFKLAPTWNLVGKSFYLRGFNFLSLPVGVDTMEWRILPKDRNTKLEIKPMRVNLSPLTLEFLSLSTSMIHDLKNNPHCTVDSIDLRLFESPWVYVLPNLTRAQLITVSKSLPGSCPFQNYDDLRRHWKNMYSYRLPKTQQGMLFYEVVLPGYPNQHFTYPEICILSKKPEILLCEKKNEITSEFLKDFTSSVHSICGERMRIGQPFPALKIEYSYTIKTRNDNCSTQKKNDLTSPFFKTPNNYVVKTSGDKLKLSSLFTFKGIDKMSSTMKNHTQQVFSIMANQSQQKSLKDGKNNCILPTTLHNTCSNPMKMKPPITRKKTQLPIDQEKTFLDSTNDVISFYDIPSMYPTESKHLERSSKNETNSMMELQSKPELSHNFLTAPVSFSCSSQQSKRPAIKSVESVNFNLTRFENPKIVHGLNKAISNNQKFNQSYEKFQTLGVSENTNIKRYNLLSDLEQDDEEFFPIYKTGKNGSKNLPSQFEYFRTCSTSNTQRGLQTVDQKSQENRTNNDPLRTLLETFNELKNFKKNSHNIGVINDEGNQNCSFNNSIEKSVKISSSRECSNKQYNEDDDFVRPFSHQESQKFSMQPSNENAVVGQCINLDKRTISEWNSSAYTFEKPEDDSHLAKNETKCVEKNFEFSAIQTYPTSDKNTNKSNHKTNCIQYIEGDELDGEILKNTAKDENCHEFSTFAWKTADNSYDNALGNTLRLNNGEKHQDNLENCERTSQNLRSDNASDVGHSPQRFAQNSAFSTNHQRNNGKEFRPSQSRNSFEINMRETVDNQIARHQSLEQKVDKGDFMSILSQSSSESDSGEYESYKLAFKEALTFNNLDENVRMSR